MADIPDLDWYKAISERNGKTTRCPFATVEACPRYYQSLSLLGEAGSTSIPKSQDNRLLAKWKKSDLWPLTRELATAVMGSDPKPFLFSNFCPEIAFDRFGYFATDLSRYADDIDVGIAHERLGQEHAPARDPRWSWASVRSQHYLDCPIYAVLSHRSKAPENLRSKPEPWWREHLAKLVIAIVVAVVTIVVTKMFS